MKNKSIISLTIALAFLSLGTTGLLLYFGLNAQAVKAIHVLFGLLFIGFVIFHIRNNWASLKVYTQERKSSGIQKEFYIALAIVLVLLTGAGFNLTPFSQLVKAGESLTRDEGEEKRSEFNQTIFTDISTNRAVKGTGLNFIIQKKQEVAAPVIAIWIEDTAHQFVQNIFVPAKVAVMDPGEKDMKRALEEGEVKMLPLTAASLPQWHSKTADTASNYAEITPTDNFFLNSKTIAGNKFNIILEIKNNDQSEIYQGLVDTSKGNAFSLKSANNTFLERVVVTIK